MLVANAVTKRFERTLALAGVDFCAREGEIHALIGENGAGKSTLINVFTGRLRPDHGYAMLDGKMLGAGSAATALAAGITAVYQSPMLFERMPWEENLALGGFSPNRFNLGAVVAEASSMAAELGFSLPPACAVVERRSVAERVRLEILRALSFKPRVLILDEPTSVLAPSELGPFLQLLRRLCNQGRIVIIVTHKLGEALAVADRITVLRRGRVAAERAAAVTSETELARLMMGSAALQQDAAIPPRNDPGGPVLELHQVTLITKRRNLLEDISLTLAAGSIVGVAGVDGNGQEELVEVMAGVRAPTTGLARLSNQADGARGVLAVIPQNRDVDGLILDLSLWENLLLAGNLRGRAGIRYGWIPRSRVAQYCQELIKRFGVRGSGPNALASSLSGGNRQRLVVARALAAEPAAIIAHDIGRGLDLAAAAELRDRLRAYAARGGAVLLISSDLDELLALCHRLYVINRGHMTEVQPEQRDPVQLGLLMSGAAQTEPAAS